MLPQQMNCMNTSKINPNHQMPLIQYKSPVTIITIRDTAHRGMLTCEVPVEEVETPEPAKAYVIKCMNSSRLQLWRVAPWCHPIQT